MYNKITTLIVAILLHISENTSAQVLLQGVVADRNNKPINAATLRLIGTPNNSEVASTSSDSNGLFRLTVPPGNYQLITTHISAKTTQQTFSLQRDTFVYISCMFKSDTLEQVTVTGRKPVLERKTDRFVFNIAGSALVQGNNVWDVLKQTPMVRVTDQGGIYVLGNAQNAVVFINRRRFNLSGEDLTALLRDMPADNIVKIEVLSIPPPSYDVSVPVIDIILKKISINGIKGNVSATYEQATVGRGNMTLELNFNKNNYNQSLYISPGMGQLYQKIDKTSRFITSPNDANIQSGITLNSERKRLNGYTDIRYSVSPVITVGTQWLFYTGASDINGEGRETLQPAALNSSFNQRIERGNNLLSGSGYIRYASEKNKRSLELSADVLNSTTTQVSSFINTPNTGSLKTDVPQDINNFASKIDFVSPLGKSVKLETGFRYSSSDINTPYTAFTYTGGTWVKVETLSALFKYREAIQAGYATLEKQFSEKWSVKAGLRVEKTQVKTAIEGNTNQNINTPFTFVFPVGYISFNPNAKHNFSLASRTNNSRPDYSSLNPARILVGIRTITEGNPFLKPSGGGAIELGYSLKQQYFFGLNYTINNRLFTQQNEVIAPDTLLIKWQNWGDQQQYSFWFYTGIDVVPSKWNMTLYSSLTHNRRLLEPEYRSTGKYANNNEGTAMINNSFSNMGSKYLKFYFNINFSTASQFGLWREDPGFRADAGASYSIAKWKARLTLAFNDIFKYNDRNVYTVNKTGEQVTRVLNNNDSRSVRITFSKSFGNQKARKFDKQSTAGEEERNRANQ